MNRRTFVKNSSLTAFSVAALGSIHWNGKTFEGDSVTTTDILGPFYRPGAPMRSNLIPKGSTGELLHVGGTIYDKDGKTPQKDVLVEVWQCDEHEHYDNTSDEYLLRGAVRTDASGSYYFKTIVPVPYKASPNQWRPAHIHFRVSSANHQDLITQIYFKGDDYLQSDPASASSHAKDRILAIGKNSSGEKEVKFDVVMGDAFPLEPGAYKKICGLYQMDNGKAEFYNEDDLLFVKLNGQLMEGMAYKGNNSFEGAIGYLKAVFEFTQSGETKVKIHSGRFTDFTKVTTHEGVKFLKY